MKTNQLIWGIVVVALILIVVAYFVGQNNLKKTAAATATAPSPNARLVGPTIVSLSNSGVGSRWIPVPNLSTGACPQGSTFGSEIGLSGPDANKCFISVPNLS